MIALYLIAAHLVGDFVLQTRWQAVGKFSDWRLRSRHVAFYSLPFYAVLAAAWPGLPRACGFLLCLMALHFLTDSRRFTSTVGDRLGWALMPTPDRKNEVVGSLPVEMRVLDLPTGPSPQLVRRTSVEPLRLPPNPWGPMPLLIDQTLHIAQIAVLSGVFLT